MKRPFLYGTVFTSGACVMTLEILGARMFAPFLGTSIYVWTSIIGVVMGGLSLGYFIGGKIADRKASENILSLILIGGGILTFITVIEQEVVVYGCSRLDNIRIGSFFAALIIFGPLNIVLGMVTPVAVKLNYDRSAHIGSSAGSVYAISTIGSIAGTFLAGFWLIPNVGTMELTFGIATVLTLCGIGIRKYSRGLKAFTFLLVGAFILVPFLKINTLKEFMSDFINGPGTVIADVNTKYNRVRIWETKWQGHDVRVFMKWDSTIYKPPKRRDQLAVQYTRFFRLAEHFTPDFKKALVIGGAGYSFPRYFLKKYPLKTIDVVEIDPGVLDLAKKYFDFQPTTNFRNIVADGRVFLNRNTEMYDVIYADTSNEASIPFQLTTREAMERMYESLNENGSLIMNIISGTEGEKGKFFRAQYHTLKEVFPQIYAFPLWDKAVWNIILVGSKNPERKTTRSEKPGLQYYLTHLYKKEVPRDIAILTDNFAPVEQYVIRALH